MSPIVTVIIPTRNRAHVLQRSIQSVLTQTMRHLELIVIDDASEDDTECVVRAIRDPRIRYMRCESGRGAPAARNAGIRAARGQYLAFQDSDDEWLPTKLERQLELLDRYAPYADAATCGTFHTEAHGRQRTQVSAHENLPYLGLLSWSAPPWGGQTIVVKRTPATVGLFFDETLPAGQDWDYVVRLAQVTNVVSVREPLVKIGRTAAERISTSRRKLEGRKLLRCKYEAELRRCPHALVEHEIAIAKLSISCGELSQARRHLLNAIRTNPFDARPVLLLVKSFLHKTRVRRLYRQWTLRTS